MELGPSLWDFISYVSPFCLSWVFCTLQAKVSNGYGYCWERQSYVHSLLTPAWPFQNRPWPGTCPYQEVKSPHSWYWAYCPVWASFPVLYSMSVPSFYSSMYVNGLQACTQLSVFHTSWGGPRVLLMWHWRGVHRLIALCWLPCRPAGHWGQTPSIEAELSRPLLCVSKGLFYPVVACVVFPLQLWYEGVMGGGVWSPPLGLVAGAWCSDWQVSIYSQILHKSIVSTLSLDKQDDN